MAHNSVIRGGTGSGAWTGVVPTPGDFETFDQRQFESINGDLGGTWAPAAQIIIGNAGLRVTSFFEMANGSSFDYDSGKITMTSFGFLTNVGVPSLFQGTVTLAATATLTVNSAATFAAALTASVGIAVNGASLFTAATTFSGTTNFTGAPTFTSVATTFSGGTLTTSSACTVNLNTTTNIGGFLNISAVAVLTGSARIRYRDIVSAGLDTTVTISPADGDFFRPPALTGNRIWTISDGGVGDKIDISLVLCTGTNYVELRRADSSTIGFIRNDTAKIGACTLVMKGGGTGWIFFDTKVGPLPVGGAP